MITNLRLSGLLAASLFLGFSEGHAAEYFVKPPADGGSDSNNGLTEQTAFATINRAASIAVAGDIVTVKAGTYLETVTPVNNGADGAMITYRAAPGEEVIIDGEFARSAGFEWANRTHLVIEGFVVRNHTKYGIGNVRPGRMVVRGNILHDNGSAGLAMNFSGTGAPHGVPSQLTIEDNVAYRNGWGEGWASGIHVNNKGEGAGTYHVIRRNVCYNNYDGSDFHTDGNGIMFDIGGAGSFALIENNICYNNGGRGINVKWGRAIVRNNVTFRNGWDPDFEFKPGEIAINADVTPGAIPNWEQAASETSLSVVENNIMWMRPRRNNWGQNFEGFGVDPDTITVSHNILWSDLPFEAASNLPLYMQEATFVNPFFFSTAQDNTVVPANGGLALQMDPSSYDFSLQGGSLAIDSGVAGAAEDHEGSPRPYGSATDIGAYEMRPLYGTPLEYWFESQGNFDGRVWGTSTGQGFVTGSPLGNDLRLGDTADVAYRSVLSFDTSSLAPASDGRVLAADLHLVCESLTNSNPFGWGGDLLVETATGTFNAADLEEGDFQAAPTGGVVATCAGSGLPESSVTSSSFDLTGLGNLSRDGVSQFRLRFAVPSLLNSFEWDYVQLYSGEADEPLKRPRLRVVFQPFLGFDPLETRVEDWLAD